MFKNVLITGGYGTLATHLIQDMLKKNFKISTLVRTLKPQNNIQNITYITNDNFFSDDYKIEDIDIIINCAFSCTNSLLNLADSIGYTKNLFLKVKENNIKALVNISSQSVYGMYRDNNTTEIGKINPGDVYALGKFACEELGNGIFQNSNTKPCDCGPESGPGRDRTLFADTGGPAYRRPGNGRDVRLAAAAAALLLPPPFPLFFS